MEKEGTQRIAAETLTILGLDASNVDSIQNVPFETLACTAEKMKAEGKPVIGFGLSWGPSRDGTDLPYQMNTDEALALSKDIPLLIGTVKNEFATFPNIRFVDASDEAIMAHI